MGRGFTTVLSALLLVAAGFVCWLLLGAPGPSAPPAPPVPPAANGDVQQAPTVPGVTQGPELPATAPRVWIEVEEKARLLPPTPPPPVVVRVGDAVVAADVTIVGGAGIGWPRPDARAGRALVRIEHQGRVLYRSVRMPAAGAMLTIAPGADLPLRGSVVDAASRPVAGARVWTGGGGQDEVETGADGSFAATVPAGDGIPVVVRAAGKAWSHRFVDRALDDGSEVQFVLADECPLEVQLVGAAADVKSVAVRVVPHGEQTTELLQYPFFAPCILGDAPVDERGRASVPGLPRGAAVGIVALGAETPVAPPVGVELRRDRARVEVRLSTQPLLRGAVVDGSGAPVGDAVLWCWPERREVRPRQEDRWLLPREVDAVGATFARTDGQGAFAIGRPAGPCVLAVAAPGRASTELALPASGAEALRIVLPQWLGEAPELRVPPPAAGVPWGVRVAPFAAAFATVAADQPFAQRLPAALVVDLRVRVQRDGGAWSAPRLLAGCAIVGAFELPAALLAR